MKEFIDKTSEKSGTPLNRSNLMAIQGYANETTDYINNSIVKTNTDTGETETTTYANGVITKVFAGKKIITQRISYSNNRIIKEIS